MCKESFPRRWLSGEWTFTLDRWLTIECGWGCADWSCWRVYRTRRGGREWGFVVDAGPFGLQVELGRWRGYAYE